MSDIDVQGYLSRLGISDPGPVSVESLFALTRAHVERVSYTSLQIHLGQRTTPDPYESAARIVAGEGGYCYHLNGAFSALLETLGYDVTWHRGRVYAPPPIGTGIGPITDEPNHLTLSVECEDRLWLVDTGLGDALHEPIPLEEGEYRQGPYKFRLVPRTTESGSRGWQLFHDPSAESFEGMVCEERIAGLGDFPARHEWMETNPRSNFVRKFDVIRRDAGGVDAMRGRVLKRKDASGISQREITDSAEWFTVLAGVFGLALPGVSDQDRELLWKRVWTKHEEWSGR
jgi:N-hydroxyarylamine O-acetyltransferase